MFWWVSRNAFILLKKDLIKNNNFHGRTIGSEFRGLEWGFITS